MTVTITITDPTATEATALRAYLTALHPANGGPVTSAEARIVGERPTPFPSEVFAHLLANQTDMDPDIAAATAENRSELYSVIDEPVSAAAAGAPDFDSAGMPWDERIHASSRATVADGTWRKKRGVSDELVAEVEAELARGGIKEMDAINEAIAEAAGTTDAQTVEVPEAPVGESTPAPTPDAPSPEPVEHVTASAPTPVDVDAPPPPPAATPNPFLAVMSRIGKSKLDKAKKDELLTAAGALDDKGNPSILVLNKRPELIDGFVALLDSEGV